jgi:ABC-type Na+ transport system ATPase subunit NatA
MRDPMPIEEMRSRAERIAPGVTPLIDGLLGCSWGKVIATPDDPDRCPDQAKQITILHDGEREIEVRLCPRHQLAMLGETNPHDHERDAR